MPSREPPAATPWKAAASAAPVGSPVRLRYLESSPILVHGPATGRRYAFSDAQPVQAVDGRDATALLRTRFFRRQS